MMRGPPPQGMMAPPLPRPPPPPPMMMAPPMAGPPQHPMAPIGPPMGPMNTATPVRAFVSTGTFDTNKTCIFIVLFHHSQVILLDHNGVMKQFGDVTVNDCKIGV